MSNVTDARITTFLAESLRPFAEDLYNGLVIGEEIIEYYQTEILPQITAAETAGELTMDSVIMDANSANGKAPMTVQDVKNLIQLMSGLQAGLDGSRTVVRKATVRPIRG